MAGIVTLVVVLVATALCYFAVGRLVIDRRERLPLSRMRAGDVIHTVRRAVGVLTLRYLPADRVTPTPPNREVPPRAEGWNRTTSI